MGAEEGTIDSFSLVWIDDLGEGYKPFAGTCRLGGAELSLPAGAREADVLAALGAPYWRQEDEEIVASCVLGSRVTTSPGRDP
ncbi:MAG: hypothetical protein HY721_34870 [Planctomycetes bacterium]|nr:hypothetical protein [Planctomycetota bacterium]